MYIYIHKYNRHMYLQQISALQPFSHSVAPHMPAAEAEVAHNH